MPKSIATYEIEFNEFIRVGERAEVFCKTHQRRELCNRPVHTSLVLSYNEETGVFETLNTIYKPINPFV